MHIVYEETKRMLRGMLPLALVTFGVFALCGQGIRITRRGYVVRYMLTAVFVIAAIKLPYLNAAAAVIPLFFTKALLLWRHAVQRKGG